jgi:hypothetical protein
MCGEHPRDVGLGEVDIVGGLHELGGRRGVVPAQSGGVDVGQHPADVFGAGDPAAAGPGWPCWTCGFAGHLLLLPAR